MIVTHMLQALADQDERVAEALHRGAPSGPAARWRVSSSHAAQYGTWPLIASGTSRRVDLVGSDPSLAYRARSYVDQLCVFDAFLMKLYGPL